MLGGRNQTNTRNSILLMSFYVHLVDSLDDRQHLPQASSLGGSGGARFASSLSCVIEHPLDGIGEVRLDSRLTQGNDDFHQDLIASGFFRGSGTELDEVGQDLGRGAPEPVERLEGTHHLVPGAVELIFGQVHEAPQPLPLRP